jgi:hypothetical protein
LARAGNFAGVPAFAARCLRAAALSDFARLGALTAEQ